MTLRRDLLLRFLKVHSLWPAGRAPVCGLALTVSLLIGFVMPLGTEEWDRTKTLLGASSARRPSGTSVFR